MHTIRTRRQRTSMSNYQGPGTNLLLLLYRNRSNMVEPVFQTRWSKQATQQAVRAEERLPRLQRNLWSFSQTYVLSIRWRYWVVFGIALQAVAWSQDSATMLHPATKDVLLCCEVQCRKACAGAPHSWCKTLCFRRETYYSEVKNSMYSYDY